MRNAAMNAIRSADIDDTTIKPLTSDSFKELLKEILLLGNATSAEDLCIRGTAVDNPLQSSTFDF